MARRMQQRSSGTGQRWRLTFWGGAAVLILMPLIAMQFGDDVTWSIGDFALLAALILVPGAAYELVIRQTSSFWYRAGAVPALATTALLVFVNGAVGVIGSEDNDANLMYGGVVVAWPAVAALGRFRASAMARAMVVAAAAQAIVAVIAIMAGAGSEAERWPLHILVLTAAFIALWIAAAWLFERAARQSPGSLRTAD